VAGPLLMTFILTRGTGQRFIPRLPRKPH
jgi:hypothetical protein